MKKIKTIHYAWILLLALCVIRSLSAAGINNTGGLFLKPVADSLGTGVGNLSIYFSISSIATLFFMPIAGKLVKTMSTKRLIQYAILIQAGSFIALGFMNHVVAWYLLAIPLGIGGAILVNLVGPILINRWFHKNAGLALGILMASVGLFGAVIQPALSASIANTGWRSSYIILGTVVLIIVLLVTYFGIKDQPSDIGLLPVGMDTETMEASANTQQTGLTIQAARSSKAFYFLIVFMITITAFGAFNQHMATYGASLGYDANRVGSILSLSMIGSSIGAIGIGLINDKIGVYKTAMGLLALIVISIISLALGATNIMLFAIGSFLLGLGSMGIPVLGPLLAKTMFGEKDYEEIYANVMMGPPLATILLLPLYGFLYDLTGSYTLVMIIMFIFILIGIVSIYIGWKKRPSIDA
ncbi:MAG: MFS transporter [Erysipelotrichaceae bacterium]